MSRAVSGSADSEAQLTGNVDSGSSGFPRACGLSRGERSTCAASMQAYRQSKYSVYENSKRRNDLIAGLCCTSGHYRTNRRRQTAARMFWFDKHQPDTLYLGRRTLPNEYLSNRQYFEIAPDALMDFRHLELPDDHFSLVVFDPPHLKRANSNNYMAKKYGTLDKATWRDDLREGFAECFRVLKPDGVLIFKWSEIEIPLKEILALTTRKPLFGHTSGYRSKTHWVAFIK